MKSDVAIKALKEVVLAYSADHGETIGELEAWSFNESIFQDNKKLSTLALKASPEPAQKGKYASKIINHLLSEGYARAHGGRYFLTKKGFDEGSIGYFKRVMNFLNENPGLISLLALIVSVVALYLSYTKA